MGNVMWWSVVLIGLLLGGFIAAAQVKKRLVRTDDLSGGGFTLSDLRALHRAGKMSDEEFEKAKQVILATTRPVAERTAGETPAERRPVGDGPAGPQPG